MPRGVSHDEEFGRISSKEHNVALGAKSAVLAANKRFSSKGQSSNPTSGGGINRPLKGKGKSKKGYTSNTN